ncbi:uncharacterized protein LOC143149401 [Ptiloglossa arizonensis]|uniref:uncharacterized protein LOC143149401 n=1 Tax=Ptiloglossa arizonensis TaxID=3350558 RepID=UPI003F9F0F66
MNNDGSSSESNGSESTEELNSRASVDTDTKSLKLSVTSNVAKKIKSKILNMAWVLKRLMRLKTDGKFRTQKNMNTCPSEIVEITEMSTINGRGISENGDSVDWAENHVVETGWHDTGCDPSIYFTTSGSEGPSTSTYANAEDQSGSRIMNATTSTLTVTEPARMISNSVNTAEVMTSDRTFLDILNRNTIVTGNILEFAEALSLPLGIGQLSNERPIRECCAELIKNSITEESTNYKWFVSETTIIISFRMQAERFSIQEHRIIPLVYINNEEGHYIEGMVRNENGFESSTVGSDISSISENEQPGTRNQRVGQDISSQLHDVSVNLVIRKPIYRRDDGSTIF